MKRFFQISLALIVIALVAFTIFWFTRPADVSFEQVRTSVPHSEFSHFADLDGLRIHYQEKGTGTPLVLLHGFTSSTYSWQDVFEPLAQNFRVIAVDLKGFGFSAKPDGDYSRRAQALMVIRLLDYLHIDKAWLGGNSMGGEIALNIALVNPQRVSGLVLIDSGGVDVPGGSSLAPRYLLLPVVGRVLTALSLTSDRLVREGLQKSFYNDALVTDERVASYYRPLQTRGGQLAALRARIQSDEVPIEADLGRLDLRTLIIWGAQDELIPLAAGRKMNSLIRNSQLVVLENCGHVPQEEMPGRVATEITRFINATPVQSK